MIVTLNSIRNGEGRIIDFEFSLVNREFIKNFGDDRNGLKGKRFFEVFDKEIWLKEYESFLDYAMKETYFKIEKEIPVADKNISYLISGVHFEEALALHFIDISVVKKSLEIVKEKEKKYQVLFENSIDPVFVLDESFRISDFNIPFADIFGFNKDEKGSKSISDLIRIKKKSEEFLNLLQNKDKHVEMAIILTNQYGQERDCIIHAAPVLHTREGPIFIGVIRDMTERKRAEKEINFAEKMATTGKLARIIAHEVRNPLTNINLALSELQSIIRDDNPEIKYYIDMIRRNSERIQILTRDFLNSSKSKTLKFEKRDVNSVIRETLEFVHDRLELKEITLKDRLDRKLPLLNIDPEQLKVGLLNLFLNAVEAMTPGKGVLEVTTRKDDGNVLILVRDNGKGISKPELDLIFDPFFSLKKDGTGLGLTVTKNIIAGHHGDIRVESQKGQGTLFIISFPVK
ncbi:MAG: PAS domain S-box protein [Cyclobacteriaceae bacterium]|nr:PAS domain S-box protein [Cyclobacteriaceae bacterium]